MGYMDKREGGSRGGNGGGFNNRGPRNFGGPRGGSGGGFQQNREMHKTTCSECGKECEVPFKPTEGKPVYCKECYSSKKKF
jgi:CxxC-x17-CxxC domain-containing protein